jgi:WS/DGAT/MGAT family acyltransferase
MLRLRGQDASFLYGETRTQYAHTLKLAILEPDEKADFASRKERFASALHLMPMFRWRILSTPLGLHHPLAIEDPELDLDAHVHRAALATPGGPRELAEFVSEVARHALDRSRPLWEMWLVEGLDDGSTAAVIKIHHALADGTMTAQLLRGVTTVHAGDPLPTEDSPWQPEPIPSRARRLWLALRDLPSDLVRIWPHFLRAARSARRHMAERDPKQRATQLYEGPNTPLNQMLSGSRRYAYASLPLAHLKEVKSAHGVTFNDVFLAIVSGALRRYLEERGALPQEPLIASCPVDARADEAEARLNKISHFVVKLATDRPDPLERLASIASDASLSKEEFEATRGAHLLDFMDLLPPPLRTLLSRLPILQKRLGRRSTTNVIVSNVKGPTQQLYWGESGLADFFSVGPLTEGVAVNFTAYSYRDHFNVSLLTDPRMLPDPWHLLELAKLSLDELRSASRPTESGPDPESSPTRPSGTI